jgi:hypothetical protein
MSADKACAAADENLHDSPEKPEMIICKVYIRND